MKVGDLVKWSDSEALWHALGLAAGHNDLVDVRQRGIIVDKNSRYFFVWWENNEVHANAPRDLEVISESW